MSTDKPTSGEKERPGGVGGGSPDRPSGDKSGSGQGGDKPSGGGTGPTNPNPSGR
jgi:hypothetical protein